MSNDFGNIFDMKADGTRTCQITRYLPGIACDRPATTVWGYGSLIEVCDFHAQLTPTGTQTELLTELFQLEDARG